MRGNRTIGRISRGHSSAMHQKLRKRVRAAFPMPSTRSALSKSGASWQKSFKARCSLLPEQREIDWCGSLERPGRNSIIKGALAARISRGLAEVNAGHSPSHRKQQSDLEGDYNVIAKSLTREDGAKPNILAVSHIVRRDQVERPVVHVQHEVSR